MRRTCLDMVYELAKLDERVVFIGSDLGPGVLDDMKREMPHRFFMEGVSEANVIGIAAGLAREGFIPYVNTIATFLTRRGMEQISVDLCLHDLPVRLIGNGGGLVYAPLGPTHIAIDDIALMRSQPNMTVVSPADADEMTRFMRQSLDWEHPIYIRLGKGGDPIISDDDAGYTIGRSIKMRNGGDVLILSSGVMTNRALAAADILANDGVGASVLHFHTLKPFDAERLFAEIGHHRLIVTLDEHLLSGGLGSAAIEAIADGYDGEVPKIARLGISDEFTHAYGSQDTLMEAYGLQPDQIAETVRRTVPARRAA